MMNDETEPFERRLSRQTQREIPAAWREEILANAQSAAVSDHAPRTTHHGLYSLVYQISTLLRPQRIAWAGLAGVWLMILAMNFATPDNSHATTQYASLPTLETLQALKQQQRLLAELMDPPVLHVANQSKTIPTGPRSQCREETTTV